MSYPKVLYLQMKAEGRDDLREKLLFDNHFLFSTDQ